MATANQRLFDSVIRHQVDVRRYTRSELKKIVRLLEEADRQLAEKLRLRLSRVPAGDYSSARLKNLLDDVRDMRREAVRSVAEAAKVDYAQLAKDEAVYEANALRAAIPIEFSVASADLRSVASAALTKPFEGRTLGQWWKTVEARDQANILQSIRLGVTQGQTTDDIVRSIIGTKANGYADGVVAMTRRNAQTVVRTAISHISTAAREEVWAANEDVILALRWTSVLDGRTSDICMARDGKLVPIGDKPLPEGADALRPEGARPPAHPNCRSIMVPVLSDEAVVGKRPTITDTRLPKDREIDFRAEARESGKSVQTVRAEWAAKNIGSVPKETNYDSWLRRQPASFQDEVLGTSRGKLFREGGLKLDQFVASDGAQVTLTRLRELHPRAFNLASVDP